MSAALPEDDAAKIDQIRDLEVLVCAAQARQARLAAALDRSQRARAADRGEPAARQGRGIAEQVALARRESPHRGRRHLALATVLERELPCTRAAFEQGRITEWRAMMIARETACLSLEDRRSVDRAIAGDPEALESCSDRVVLHELRKLAARLDPASVAERRRRAEAERHVSVRPAPDTMAYLTVLLPVAQAVACYATLKVEADTAVATGDPHSRGQVMADTLVARVTGSTDETGRPVVPVSIGLVMTDQALLAGAHDTAHIEDHGPIPAGLARDLILAAGDAKTRIWLRRLFTSPSTGELVAMDSRQRLLRRNLARFIRHRDQWCRSPWCNAPIRHGDHVTDWIDTGITDAADAQGLCVSCNHAKQGIGWRARPSPGDTHTVEITTPTGHTYTSHAPPVVGLRRGAYQQLWEGHWALVG
ncbi:DUF222 domain-containing protein [Nocardioides sp.]|uniref:DUF222 domain-containing protein n=1 Tax=Nocardioides sp. TaxID=35761 RepID=UPI002EDAE88A